MTVGSKIRQIRKERSLTLNELAARIDSDVGNLSRLERGQQGYTDSILQRIAAALEVPVASFFVGENLDLERLLAQPGIMAVKTGDASAQDPNDPLDFSTQDSYYRIQLVELKLSAGFTGFQAQASGLGEPRFLTVPPYWIDKTGYSPDRLIAIHVKGESMEPSLYEGDLVIINTADTQMADGAVFAVNYEGEAVIKRLSRDMGQWWLTSDHPDQRKYHRKSCRSGECIMIGRVVRRETDRI